MASALSTDGREKRKNESVKGITKKRCVIFAEMSGFQREHFFDKREISR